MYADGDTCETVASEFSITVAQFLTWNPAVSSDCASGFWLEEAYCVGVSSTTTTAAVPTTTTTKVTTTAKATTATTVSPPAPTQTGIASNCDQYYVPVGKLNHPSPFSLPLPNAYALMWEKANAHRWRRLWYCGH